MELVKGGQLVKGGSVIVEVTASEKATVPSISSPLTLSAQRSVLVAEPTLVC